MLVRNVAAVIWFVMSAGWGYWAYRQIIRRLGRRPLGRFGANWAFMTGWFIGIAGFAVLWNGGRTEPRWRQGRYSPSYQWQWSEAIPLALAGGALAGTMLTWVRRRESYQFDVPSTEPFIDDDEVAEILEAERRSSPEARRELAANLRAEARARRQSLPPAVEAFVQRNHPRRLTKR